MYRNDNVEHVIFFRPSGHEGAMVFRIPAVFLLFAPRLPGVAILMVAG